MLVLFPVLQLLPASTSIGVTNGPSLTTTGISNAEVIAGATSIDGTGDLTMGTITMTGFTVDADGDVATKSINNNSGGITNAGSISGASTVTASTSIGVTNESFSYHDRNFKR